MERSRIALYAGIALVTLVIVYYILVDEPQTDCQINLIHLLFRH